MKDYIADCGTINEDELKELLQKYAGENASLYYITTTRFGCDRFAECAALDDISHLLEVRLFDSKRELKAIRSQMGKSFVWRLIDDDVFKKKLSDISCYPDREFDGCFKMRIFEDTQYLDVDDNASAKISSPLIYAFQGGGTYSLPVENAARVQLYNYLTYNDNGMACFEDFRICAILKKGEKSDGEKQEK